jgi:hypothetical protein
MGNGNVAGPVERSVRPRLVIIDSERLNLRLNLQRHVIDFLNGFKLHENIVVLRVRMPINVFNAPLCKQTVNLALDVKSLQFSSFVGQVRGITINFQNFACSKTSDSFWEKGKAVREKSPLNGVFINTSMAVVAFLSAVRIQQLALFFL